MTQIREEVAFTKGRIIVRRKPVTRGKAKRADYIPYYKPGVGLGFAELKGSLRANRNLRLFFATVGFLNHL